MNESLDTPTPTVRDVSDRTSFFIQEPFGQPRTSRIAIIADGTTRGGPNGIAEGAMRVVECAEFCAQRDDVTLLAMFILSPQNLRRRQKRFFAALHAEFLRLTEAVVSGRQLVGVRIETHGRLDRLARKCEVGARLVHVLELLCEATSDIQDPRLRLVFCIDYDENTPLELGLDVLLRTGMEEPGVLRLSGLRVSPSTVCIASATLWRHFAPAHLETALALAAETARPGLTAGFSTVFVADFLRQLARASFVSPLRITMPLVASGSEKTALLEGAALGPVNPDGRVAVTAGLAPHEQLGCVGPRDARVQVHLMTPGQHALELPDEPIAWLAPGQRGQVFHLMARSAKDANIHVCEPTPEGIVEGLQRALHFLARHPPLHGAPRDLGSDRTGAPADTTNPAGFVSVGHRSLGAEIAGDRPDIDIVGQHFAARCISEIRASGLFSGQVDWERQAFGYAMTAYGIGGRFDDAVGAPSQAAGNGREAATRAVAHVMLAMASSDEEITDRIFPGEDDASRRKRVATSVEYLIARIRGDSPEHPDVDGANILRAIGRTWERFFSVVGPTVAPPILHGLRRSAENLYRANIEELAPCWPLCYSQMQVATGPSADISSPRDSNSLGLRREFRRRAWLRAWLTRMAPSIGAGCALLAMAATEPAWAIPTDGATEYLRIMPLFDRYFRLANDLSFADAIHGDRDCKLNSFTCLIPSNLTGKPLEWACVEAYRTCRNAAAKLEEEIARAIGELSHLWPVGARWLQRGMYVGRRAYEMGHYERLDPTAMAGIVADLPDTPTRPCLQVRTNSRLAQSQASSGLMIAQEVVREGNNESR